jgi:hypothetical protein
VDGVVAHGQAVDVLLAGGELVDPLGVGEPVQVVVAEALVGGAAVLVGCGYGDVVFEGEDVSDLVVAVEEVLERVAVAFAGSEVCEPSVVRVVRVAASRVVSVLDEGPLLELVVFQALEVVVAEAAAYAGGRAQQSP